MHGTLEIEPRTIGFAGTPAGADTALRLHVGGRERRAGWKILNIQPGPDVDYVGDCCNLLMFADASVEEIYASHVLEHLGYQQELPRALGGMHRILRPGGRLRISVPDLGVLCRLFVLPGLDAQQRLGLMRIIYGGQMDAFDFHKGGWTLDTLSYMLQRAGFAAVRRVAGHGLFDDTSELIVMGEPISLNVIATKGGA